MDMEDKWSTEPTPPLQTETNKLKVVRMQTEFDTLTPEEVLEVLSNKVTETELGFGNT
jgi:hypothetical protein